ncbi:hypothetical protein MMC11_006732 [Xylographa trunciseda]|nr:hypothetical protein [Xylographa trunciseda]
MGFLTPSHHPKPLHASEVTSQNVFNGRTSSTAILTGGLIGNTESNGPASSADIALWKQRREAALARGEDPEQWRKDREAKKEARKAKVKSFFNIRSRGSDTAPVTIETQKPLIDDRDDGVIR